jgi:AraC-like DNA-binding protein
MVDGVILLRRTTLLPGHAGRTFVGLRRPGLRLYAVQLDGTIFDSRPLQAMMARHTSGYASGGEWLVGQVTVVLAGAMVIRRGDREVEVPEQSYFCEGKEPWDERWQGRHFACLVLEWGRDFGPPLQGRDGGVVRSAEAALARQIHAELLHGDSRGEAGAMLLQRARGLAALLGVGLPPWDPARLREEPRGAQALADRLSEALSHLEQQPMWVDFASPEGQSERQLRRRLIELTEWLEVPEGSLRQRLVSTRLTAAATLLAAPGAQIEAVARAVGYRSSQALATALRQHELPSPSELRAAMLTGQKLP